MPVRMNRCFGANNAPLAEKPGVIVYTEIGIGMAGGVPIPMIRSTILSPEQLKSIRSRQRRLLIALGSKN